MRSRFWAICWRSVTSFQIGAIVVAGSVVSPVQAQSQFLPNLNLPTPNVLNKNSPEQAISACIRLDGELD
jgi:hypothetical protein